MGKKPEGAAKGKTPKLLSYSKLILKNKDDSEIEMILDGCQTTRPKLMKLMRQYASETLERQPSVVNEVKIFKFYADNQMILGWNQEQASNKYSIYFSGNIEKERLVFDFFRKNKTLAYLMDFCFNYTRIR
jgi:hypothetical protein